MSKNISCEASAKLQQLKSLPPNWDSYGSCPIQPEVIEMASSLLTGLAKLDMPEPHIVPVPGGGIQFEWENSERGLEIEILPDKSIEYLLLEKEGMDEGRIDQDDKLAEIVRCVDWVMTCEGKSK